MFPSDYNQKTLKHSCENESRGLYLCIISFKAIEIRIIEQTDRDVKSVLIRKNLAVLHSSKDVPVGSSSIQHHPFQSPNVSMNMAQKLYVHVYLYYIIFLIYRFTSS